MKWHNHRNHIVSEKLRFENVFRPHQKAKPAFPNFSGWKSVFGKLCFRNLLVLTVGLTAEIKLRIRDGLVWTVDLSLEIKLHFRDRLVWTVHGGLWA